MSNSDFFKRLYLAGVTNGQASATSSGPSSNGVFRSVGAPTPCLSPPR